MSIQYLNEHDGDENMLRLWVIADIKQISYHPWYTILSLLCLFWIRFALSLC